MAPLNAWLERLDNPTWFAKVMRVIGLLCLHIWNSGMAQHPSGAIDRAAKDDYHHFGERSPPNNR